MLKTLEVRPDYDSVQTPWSMKQPNTSNKILPKLSSQVSAHKES